MRPETRAKRIATLVAMLQHGEAVDSQSLIPPMLALFEGAKRGHGRRPAIDVGCYWMPENKTKPTDASVEDFLVATTPDRRRDDARRVVELMTELTGEQPVMWGSAIIGFGKHHYRYASGREGDICRVGVSPRKAGTVLYMTCDLDRHQSVLDRLGPHDHGVGCLYIKRLDAVDESVLRELIEAAWAQR